MMEQVKLKKDRPLLTPGFLTDGIDLFIEHSGLLLSTTEGGQTRIRQMLERYLDRIERSPKGFPIRLFPFSRHAGDDDARKIVIAPTVAFGRPVLIGTSIPTAAIFDRFLAGDPITDLARDYRVKDSLIEEAIRCEQVKALAA